jgi:hypothetical protein
VHRIGEHEGEAALEDMPHGPPVDAGRFHRHVRDVLARQPVQELEPAASRRRDRPPFMADRRTGGDPYAPDDRLGVHIQPGTPRIEDVHASPPSEPHGRGVPGYGI